MNEGKKSDLPAMPFYFGDWRKSPEVRALDLDVRMIWFEMLGLMWESTERGYLTLNGKCVSNSVITKMLGVDITTFEQALKQMEDFNVFSRRGDGAIYSRKMVRDEEIRRIKSEAGKVGMEKRYSKSVITPDITERLTNAEDETETVIDYESIIETFNKTGFAKVQKLSDARKKHLKARIKEYSIDKVKEVFLIADKSDFLRGINKNSWTATFDWIINPNNFVKIIEGNYDNKKKHEYTDEDFKDNNS